MSASPMARQATTHHAIPTRRVVIQHEADMPLDYGTTPGGTIFGTTPGGTKIVYERAFLMQMRHSPLAKSPPANLPNIPGVTSPTSGEKGDHIENGNRIDPAAKLSTVKECNKEDEDQFDMDI